MAQPGTAAFGFMYWFLPEIKGLPVGDIVRLFGEREHLSAPDPAPHH